MSQGQKAGSPVDDQCCFQFYQWLLTLSTCLLALFSLPLLIAFLLAELLVEVD